MEEEQSTGPEKQELTDHEQGATQQAGGTTTTTTTTTAAVRSYECNFCKRGFTNAQALGGHMNIHRKDKAKLKQSSTTTASSDPPTSQPQHFPPSPNFLPPPNMFQHHPGKWTFSSSKDHSTAADIHTANKSITTHEVKNQLSLVVDHQSPLPPPPADEPPAELDLELRLGHNTDQPSSDQKGTRKFF